MMPWRPNPKLTSLVIEVFNGLRGQAREKAIATGNYAKLVEKEPEPDDERSPRYWESEEPGNDEPDYGSQA